MEWRKAARKGGSEEEPGLRDGEGVGGENFLVGQLSRWLAMQVVEGRMGRAGYLVEEIRVGSQGAEE